MVTSLHHHGTATTMFQWFCYEYIWATPNIHRPTFRDCGCIDVEQTEYFLCCINPGEKDTFHLFNDFDAIIGSVDNNLIPLDFVAEYNVRLAKTGARFLDEKAHKCFEIWLATDIFMREEIKSLTNTRRRRYMLTNILLVTLTCQCLTNLPLSVS